LDESNPVYVIFGRASAISDGDVGIVTSSERERERAIPQTSKPGPTFAVVAGTVILNVRDIMRSKRGKEEGQE